MSIAIGMAMNATIAAQQLFLRDVWPHLILATMAIVLFVVLISTVFIFLIVERWFSGHRPMLSLWWVHIYSTPKAFRKRLILLAQKVAHIKRTVAKTNSFISQRPV